MGSAMWFREFERLLNEKEDAGIPADEAYEQASNEASGAVQDRIADMIDDARQRRKDDLRDQLDETAGEGEV